MEGLKGKPVCSLEGKIVMNIRKALVLLATVASALVCMSSGVGATSLPGGTIVNRTTVGNNPQGISSDGTDVWVTNEFSNSVSEIQASTGAVINTIAVGGYPQGISSDGTDVWVANSNSNSVSEIQASTGTVINTISVGGNPQGVSSDGTDVWVANYTSNSVTEIQASTGTVINTISVGSYPYGISSDGTHVWVTNSASWSVSEIQASTGIVINTIPVGAKPQGISSDGNDVWVANTFDDSVSEIQISTASVIRTILVGSEPPAISSDGTDVWVANQFSNSVSEIQASTGTVINTIHVGANGSQLRGISADGIDVWVIDVDVSSSVYEVVAAGVPYTITSVTDALSNGGNTADFSWIAPVFDGGSTITGYTVQTSTDGINWTNTSEPVGRTTFSTELNQSATFYFQVAANNHFGTGQFSSVILITRSCPDSPIGVTDTVPLGGGTVNFSWSAPNFVGGSPITGYSVQTSRDGIHWSTAVTTSSTSYSASTRGPGTGLYFRVAAKNVLGVGAYSVPKLAVIPGLSPQNIKVLTSTGQPVSGGAITWVASGIRSSHTYGLTSTGEIQFPAAPAGSANVSLTNGVLPDGDYVSGTYPVILGLSGGATITLPAMPSIGSTLVNVEAPGGLNLPGAVVTVPGVTQSSVVDGTTFTTPQVSNAGTTDLDGNFTVRGFIAPGAQASVSYDDGVVTQTTVVPIIQPLTNVVFNNDPVIIPITAKSITTAGSVISVTLSASAIVNPSFAHLLLLAGASAVKTRTAMGGLRVQAVLPRSFKSCIAQQLSGTTNAQGQVTLKFCATTTGLVRFRANGAYVAGAFNVFVKGTAPTAVLAPLASTPQLGHASLTWTVPAFNGGSPITKYVVTFSATGKRTVVVNATSTHINLGGLADATRYNVSIVAVNKTGNSPATSLKVSVA
jgi:YVTN family beta-propeller protein